jgi:hypothetical protein
VNKCEYYARCTSIRSYSFFWYCLLVILCLLYRGYIFTGQSSVVTRLCFGSWRVTTSDTERLDQFLVDLRRAAYNEATNSYLFLARFGSFGLVLLWQHPWRASNLHCLRLLQWPSHTQPHPITPMPWPCCLLFLPLEGYCLDMTLVLPVLVSFS